MNKNTLRWVVYAGLFLVPFVPFLVSSSLFFPFITTKAFVWRIIVEIIFAAWLVVALLDKECRPKKSPILYAVVGFLAVIGVANLFGAAPLKSFWSNYERMEGFISLLHLGAFFLVIGSVFREHDWRRWWNTSLFASAIMVIYCLSQLAGAININQGGVRVDGTFGNASYLAVYMLIHIFISILFLWREWKDTVKRYAYGILLFGQLFILYHTATRGAILGFLGGLLIAAVLNLRNKENPLVKKTSVVVVGILIAIVAGFALLKDSSFVKGSPVLSRFSTISTEELKSGGRAFVWPMAVKGIMERPILGWGQENFSFIFQKYYEPEMYRLEPWFDRAHNIFLDWAVAGGLLGLLFYLSLYAVSLNIIWRKDENFSHTEKSLLTALIGAYFFHNFFVFDHLLSYVLFFSLLAYFHSRVAKANLFEAEVSELRVRTVLAPLAAVLLVGTIYFINWRPLVANASLINSLRYNQTGQTQHAANALRKAYDTSYVGRREVVEQIVAQTVPILQSQLPLEEKNKFFSFARQSVVEESDRAQDDARMAMVAGLFFRSTGYADEALAHLERAKRLSPNKQSIRIEIADAYLAKGDKQSAIESLRSVIELSPELREEIEGYIKQISSQ